MAAPPLIIRGARPTAASYSIPTPSRRPTRPLSTSSSSSPSPSPSSSSPDRSDAVKSSGSSGSSSSVSTDSDSDSDLDSDSDSDSESSDSDTGSGSGSGSGDSDSEVKSHQNGRAQPTTSRLLGNNHDDDDSDRSTSSQSDDEDDLTSVLPGAWTSPLRKLRGFASAAASTLMAQPAPTNVLKVSATQASRAHIRLSLALLRVRHAISSASFDSLLTAVKALSSILAPLPIDTLGVFVPILDRLAYDLEQAVSGEHMGKAFRKDLSSYNAKALVALRQKCANLSLDKSSSSNYKGKGKSTESEMSWVPQVRALVLERSSSMPSFMSRPYDAPTAATLTALESLLLPSSLPRINLSNLGLTSDQLASLEPFREAERVLEWYLSFHSSRESIPNARGILDNVTSLDLSKNKLDSFPGSLHKLLPSLETMTISNNQFEHIPSNIVLFSSLRRLRRHGNNFAKQRPVSTSRNKKAGPAVPAEPAGTNSNTRFLVETILSRRKERQQLTEGVQPDTSERFFPSLVSTSIHLLHQHMSSFTSESSKSLLSNLPPHLEEAVKDSYECASCRVLITPLPYDSQNHLPPFFEKVHHLDPGVSLPSQQITAPRNPDNSSPTNPNEMLSTSPTTNRIETPPPPPGAASARYLLTLEERVLLALHARNSDRLQTFIIGDTRHHRYCTICAGFHLGVDEFREVDAEVLVGNGGRTKCDCGICKEERRIKGVSSGFEEEGEGRRRRKAGIMRWLRRKAPRSSVVGF